MLTATVVRIPSFWPSGSDGISLSGVLKNEATLHHSATRRPCDPLGAIANSTKSGRAKSVFSQPARVNHKGQDRYCFFAPTKKI